MVCTCALRTTGICVGVFGYYDIHLDGCVLEPYWEDLAGLRVEAACENIIAYVDMTDSFQASFYMRSMMVNVLVVKDQNR